MSDLEVKAKRLKDLEKELIRKEKAIKS